MADNGDRNDATPQEIRGMLRELTASQRETDRQMKETDRSSSASITNRADFRPRTFGRSAAHAV